LRTKYSTDIFFFRWVLNINAEKYGTSKFPKKRSGNSLGFMINDDRFILGSLENWEFGVDNTGDLMNPANLEQLVARCRQLGDIHLVTADGSIDCQVPYRH
jgi:hypothetical protein